MNTLRNLTEKIDIYGEEFRLRIDGKEKSKTTLGGVFTFLTISLIATAAWYLGNDLIFNENAIVNIEEKLYPKRPEMYLNRENFPFSFALQDINQKLYDLPSEYFSYELISSEVFNQNGTVNQMSYEIEKCNYSHFPKITPEDFDKAGMSNYLCLKNQNVSIGGFFDEERMKFLRLSIKMCKGSPNCHSEEEITKKTKEIDQLSFCIYIQNSLINTKDFKDPMKYHILNKWKIVTTRSLKSYFIYLNRQDIITDSGMIFQDFSQQFSYYFDSSETDDELVGEDGKLVDIFFFAGNRQPIVHRRYIKLQEIIASLGGLLQVVMVVSSILISYFAQIRRDQSIMNKIFNFEMLEEKATNSNKVYIDSKCNYSNNLMINNIRRYSRFNLYNSITNKNILNCKPNLNKEILSEITKKLKTAVESQENKKLTLTTCELMKFFLCRCVLPKNKRRKYILFNLGKKKLDEFLDISTISQKLEELDTFKLVVFNEQQIAMFHFISKYVITDNPLKASLSKINILKDFTKNNDNLINFIFQIKNKLTNDPNISLIDQKLYDMMNPILLNELKLN